MHWRMSCLAIATSLSMPLQAHAAKMHVTWVAPTTNTDGSVLTDLVGYRVEWGSCNANGSFGIYQAGINVASVKGSPPATQVWIYPTGLNPVCAHVFSINSQNLLSAASNTSSGIPPPTLIKPTR